MLRASLDVTGEGREAPAGTGNARDWPSGTGVHPASGALNEAAAAVPSGNAPRLRRGGRSFPRWLCPALRPLGPALPPPRASGQALSPSLVADRRSWHFGNLPFPPARATGSLLAVPCHKLPVSPAPTHAITSAACCPKRSVSPLMVCGRITSYSMHPRGPAPGFCTSRAEDASGLFSHTCIRQLARLFSGWEEEEEEAHSTPSYPKASWALPHPAALGELWTRPGWRGGLWVFRNWLFSLSCFLRHLHEKLHHLLCTGRCHLRPLGQKTPHHSHRWVNQLIDFKCVHIIYSYTHIFQHIF